MLSERPSKQTRTTAAAWSFEYWAKGLSQATHRIVGVGWGTSLNLIPAIAQLAEHLTVDSGSDQMVPGSIPGGRTFLALRLYAARGASLSCGWVRLGGRARERVSIFIRVN